MRDDIQIMVSSDEQHKKTKAGLNIYIDGGKGGKCPQHQLPSVRLSHVTLVTLLLSVNILTEIIIFTLNNFQSFYFLLSPDHELLSTLPDVCFDLRSCKKNLELLL